MKIAALQMDIAWHDREANFKKVYAMASEAKAAGADLLVLPETFSTGFSMDSSFTSETEDGPSPRFLRFLARDLQIAVIGGFVLKQENQKPLNVALTVSRHGNDLSRYAKMHLIGILGETNQHAPGETPVIFDLEGTRISCFICYDLRFPELFQAVADQCDLMIIIASWPAIRQKHWDLLLQARAVENQCYVAGVNRVGSGGGYAFQGGTAMIDPLGTVLAQAGNEERLITADMEPANVNEVRTLLPFLRDRRPEYYQSSCQHKK